MKTNYLLKIASGRQLSFSNVLIWLFAMNPGNAIPLVLLFQLSAGNARGRHSTGRPDSIASSRRSVISAPSLYASIFFTDVQNPYRTYFCHFEITCQQTDLFQLVQFPLCVDAKDPQKAQRIFRTLFNPVSRRIFLPLWRPNRLSFICSAIILNAARLEVSLSFHNPLTLHFPVQFPMLKHICMSRLPYNRWQKWPAIIPVTLQNYFKPTWEFLLDSLFCRKNGNCNAAFNFYRSAHFQDCRYPRFW